MEASNILACKVVHLLELYIALNVSHDDGFEIKAIVCGEVTKFCEKLIENAFTIKRCLQTIH